MSEPIVIDASVAIKWIVEEEDSDLARRLAQRDLLAPELLHLECLSAIWRRIVRRQLTPGEAPVLLRLLEAIRSDCSPSMSIWTKFCGSRCC